MAQGLRKRELRRTNVLTGAVFLDSNVTSRRLVEQRIAWHCTDNELMSRREAGAQAIVAGRALWDGEKVRIGAFDFELVQP